MTRKLFPTNGLPGGLRAGFEAFWAAYPTRKPNPRALAEVEYFAAVRAGAEPDALARAAAAYAAECTARGVGNDFIVHASTFLRQQRWRDYLPKGPTPEVEAKPARALTHPLWPLVKGQLNEATFSVWLGQLVVEEDGAERLVLRAPSAFVAAHVRAEFGGLLRQAARGRRVEVLGPGSSHATHARGPLG
jgi:hypothetical protein